MKQKYNGPDEVSDAVIKKAFARATSVKFSARRFNFIQYRQIAFDDIGWWLPLRRVLPILGITPQMLRPVFSDFQLSLEKRSFPFNSRWLGLNKQTHKAIKLELPKNIESYEELGEFPLSDKPFQELAKILGKSVEVWREDGGTGEHYHIFTACPSGEIIEVEKNR